MSSALEIMASLCLRIGVRKTLKGTAFEARAHVHPRDSAGDSPKHSACCGEGHGVAFMLSTDTPADTPDAASPFQSHGAQLALTLVVTPEPRASDSILETLPLQNVLRSPQRHNPKFSVAEAPFRTHCMGHEVCCSVARAQQLGSVSGPLLPAHPDQSRSLPALHPQRRLHGCSWRRPGPAAARAEPLAFTRGCMCASVLYTAGERTVALFGCPRRDETNERTERCSQAIDRLHTLRMRSAPARARHSMAMTM